MHALTMECSIDEHLNCTNFRSNRSIVDFIIVGSSTGSDLSIKTKIK